MFQAKNDDHNIISAAPGTHAICPLCDEPVVAKCGDIVTWHFAHLAGADCDTWSEGEGPWHLGWKERAAPNRREVKIGNHRADIVSRDGVVIELQHSPISSSEITEREKFYRDMVWLFDVTEPVFNGRLIHHPRDVFEQRWVPCRPHLNRRVTWKHPRKSIAFCLAPVFLDVDAWDDGWLLRLDYFDADVFESASGTLVRKQQFVETFIA